MSDEALKTLLRESRLPVYVLYEKDTDGRYSQVATDLRGLPLGIQQTAFLYKTWDSAVSQKAKAALPSWHVVTQSAGADSQFVYDTGPEYAFRSRECFFFSPGQDVQDRDAPFRKRMDPKRFRDLALLARHWLADWPWVIVPFNEYPEQTQIEPANGDNGVYLQALREAWA